ncbi:MAG: methyltransferase domain-containing protein [Anaerolineae bacterium]
MDDRPFASSIVHRPSSIVFPKMPSYFSTFASGLQEVAQDALARQLGDAKIELALDGLIVYQTGQPIQQIKNIRFFNNTFLLLRLFQNPREAALAPMMTAVMKAADALVIPPAVTQAAQFYRITASRHNQTTPIDRDTLAQLERVFSPKLGLRVHRTLPDVEVWFLERSEGLGLAGIRLTRRAATEKELQRGELKPELANILCLISEPNKDDVFLDPFAGSGAIPLERARGFPARRVLASDINPLAVKHLRARAAQEKVRLAVEECDALALRHVADGALDKIVTDPPWGLFEAQNAAALSAFYAAMLREFERVLKPGGLAIVLMGQKELFEGAIPAAQLETLNRYDILVSGKKAAIYKLRKRALTSDP